MRQSQNKREGEMTGEKEERRREEEGKDERKEMRGQGRWEMGREGLKSGFVRREVKSELNQVKR